MASFAIRGPTSARSAQRSSGVMIGVISDTHGLLRPEALKALAGSQLIIHAGDIGDPGILDVLRTIAPVVAVRGNIDTASTLPEFERIEQGGKSIYILH